MILSRSKDPVYPIGSIVVINNKWSGHPQLSCRGKLGKVSFVYKSHDRGWLYTVQFGDDTEFSCRRIDYLYEHQIDLIFEY